MTTTIRESGGAKGTTGDEDCFYCGCKINPCCTLPDRHAGPHRVMASKRLYDAVEDACTRRGD